jgi:hypothetical protein
VRIKMMRPVTAVMPVAVVLVLALALVLVASSAPARGADGGDNYVWTSFDTAQQYNTDEDSVSNTTLDGYLQVSSELKNPDDSSDGSLVGASAEGGPVLDLATTGATSDVQQDHLASGSVPGTDFTWGLPALAEDEGWGSWAVLEGTESFSPGFAVGRSADQTVFDSSGGTQVLTLTVTPGEAIDRLNIGGGSPRGGYGYFTASITDVEWVGDPPASSDLDFNENGFWGGINNGEADVTYTLAITTEVTSTLDGVNVTYVPDIDVRNQQADDSSTDPESASTFERVLTDGTFTWALEGTYLWEWNETESRAVHLNGHVTGDGNFVWADFDTAQQYNTDGDSVANATLDGHLQVSAWWEPAPRAVRCSILRQPGPPPTCSGTTSQAARCRGPSSAGACPLSPRTRAGGVGPSSRARRPSAQDLPWTARPTRRSSITPGAPRCSLSP